MASKSNLMLDEEDDKTECCLKVLIPAYVIGSIMGMNGDILHHLEVDTGTKITISGPKDFYPGTKERVCLISGNIASVSKVNRTIMDKIFVNTHTCCKAGYKISEDRVNRGNQVKMLIPQSVASKVIGKVGCTISRIKQISGSSVQLSRRAFPTPLLERFVVVSGAPVNNDIACRMILKIVADETRADYYKNVSYSKENYYILPNANVKGPPLATAEYKFTSETLPESLISGPSLMLFLEQLKEMLKSNGLSEEKANLAAECILELSNHRVIDYSLSMMINWLYPCNSSAIKQNKDTDGIEEARYDSPEQKIPPYYNSSMFAQLDPSLLHFPEPIPRNFGQSFTSEASGSNASSDTAATGSDHGIQKSVSASASTDFQSKSKDVSVDFAYPSQCQAFGLPPPFNKPEDFNGGNTRSKCYSTNTSTGFSPNKNFPSGNAS